MALRRAEHDRERSVRRTLVAAISEPPGLGPGLKSLCGRTGTMADEAPLVGIIMGSRSDWETMRHAAEMLDALGIPYESRIVSAHRTPERLYDYARSAAERG